MIVFPLWPFDSNGQCECGTLDCRNAGKHPKINGWQQLTESASLEGPAYGIQCGERSGIFVVDCDSDDAAAVFLETYRPAETRTVRTGKGWHFYFKHPGFRVKNSTKKLLPNVDIRGDGGFVVGPGSPHVSGKSYELANDAEPADAPDELVQWLRDQNLPPMLPPAPIGEGSDVPAHVDWFRKLCGEYDPSIQGENGSGLLFTICQKGVRAAELTDQAVFDLVKDVYNPRCVPPWSDQEILRCVRNARKSGTMPTGSVRFAFEREAARAAKAAEQENPIDAPIAGKKKKATNAEIAYLLQNDPAWEGVLAYDAFRNVTVFRKPPPFPHTWPIDTVTDTHVAEIRLWFENSQSLLVGIQALDEAIDLVARRASFHPVRDWFATLGASTPGTIDALARVLNPDATPDEVIYLRKFMIGAVRRVHDPGCQVDTMLVLVGPQGVGKSTLIRTLFGANWTSILYGDLSARDTREALSGVWAMELAELAHASKTEQEQEKNFLSTRVDRYRVAYGRRNEDHPRQCVFVGTTNAHAFLRDETGERRKWPFPVPYKVNREHLEALRDLAWAEARDAANAGEEHWLTDEETARLQEAQKPYEEREPCYEKVLDYLSGREKAPSTSVILVTLYPELAKAPLKKMDVLSVTKTLRLLRCVPKHTRRGTEWVIPKEITERAPSKEEAARQAREANTKTN